MTEITNALPELNRDLQFYPIENRDAKKLTPDQIAQFNEKGYIFPLDVFSENEIRKHREYFDQLVATELEAGRGGYSINGWHARRTGIYDLVIEDRILDYVQDLLGEDLICWGTHYFSKMPFDPKQVAFHQDASYWPLTPSKTVTVWLAIDDADQENGAMQFIPGSHRAGQIGFQWSKAEEQNVLGQTVHNPDRFGEPISAVLKAGQISLHSDLLLHGSQPNRSDRRRCGLTMRFVPPEVKALTGWNRNSIIARGTDPSGHWEDTQRPSE